MKTYSNKCPSVFDFENYLTNKMNNKDKLMFENHAQKCALCNEALEGFRNQNVRVIQPVLNKVHKAVFKQVNRLLLSKKVLQIAASVIVFVGLGVSVKLMSDKLNFSNLAGNVDFDKIETTQYKGLKRIISKSVNQYIYLGKENSVLVNDELVSLAQLKSGNVVNANTKQLIVQVESDNYESSQQLISTIKDKHQIPVFAFRTIRN